MLIVVSVALGFICGLVSKGININITHKSDVDKSSDDGYNKSVGDPDAVLYLDRQHGGE